jgi:hypothetical protein
VAPPLLDLKQEKNAHPVLHGAVIGLLVGALGGALVAVTIESNGSTPQNGIRERESGYAYVVFVPAGAAMGAIVGAAVGHFRK